MKKIATVQYLHSYAASNEADVHKMSKNSSFWHRNTRKCRHFLDRILYDQNKKNLSSRMDDFQLLIT